MKNGAPTKVVLNDGTVTDSWSRAWQCEVLARVTHVRNVLAMLGKSNRIKRDQYYASVRELEGEEAEKRLREAVAEKWEAEKQRLEGDIQ